MGRGGLEEESRLGQHWWLLPCATCLPVSFGGKQAGFLLGTCQASVRATPKVPTGPYSILSDWDLGSWNARGPSRAGAPRVKRLRSSGILVLPVPEERRSAGRNACRVEKEDMNRRVFLLNSKDHVAKYGYLLVNRFKFQCQIAS